jgi:hypothetical protein
MSLLKSAVALSAAAVLTAAGVLPASATARPHAPTAGAHVRIKAIATSTVGAGDFVTPGSPNVSSASATFTIPTITCNNPSDYKGVFPGIWIYDSTGNLVHQVDVNLYCESGIVHYTGVVCIAGSSQGCVTSLTVSPGDRMVATFSESAFHTQGQLYDLTTHTHESIYDGTPAPTDDYTVFIGAAGPVPFGHTHVPMFDHINFTKCQVDGYYLFEYVSSQIESLKSASYLQVRASALHGDGDAFTATFAHI